MLLGDWLILIGMTLIIVGLTGLTLLETSRGPEASDLARSEPGTAQHQRLDPTLLLRWRPEGSRPASLPSPQRDSASTRTTSRTSSAAWRTARWAASPSSLGPTRSGRRSASRPSEFGPTADRLMVAAGVAKWAYRRVGVIRSPARQIQLRKSA